ncbi:hypothetical protein AB7W30_19925 [Providencia manganoxydans]|uniref:hypothetical protein n=1 Tax=Providencia manganoxydans TaxID=2923283 RepID=UPI0032DBE0AC
MKDFFFLSQKDIKGIINKNQTQVIRVANSQMINNYILSNVGKQLKIKEHYFMRDGKVKYMATDDRMKNEKLCHAANMPEHLIRLSLKIECVEIKLLSDLTDEDAKIHGFESKEKLIRRYKFLKCINENTEVLVFNFTYNLKN